VSNEEIRRIYPQYRARAGEELLRPLFYTESAAWRWAEERFPDQELSVELVRN
jgi:hypothetical protein